MVVLVQNLLYSGKKMVVFGQSGCFRAKVVGGCIREKKWLYSDKVVVFGKSGCVRSKWL